MAQINISKISESIMPSVYSRNELIVGRILRKYPLKVQHEIIHNLWDRLLSLEEGSHFIWFVDKIELPFNAAYLRHIKLY